MKNKKQLKLINEISYRVKLNLETQNDFETLERFSKLGFSNAMIDYSVCLIKRGYKEKAIKWLKKASINGDGHENYVISGLFAILGNQYINESIDCLKKAADQGNIIAKNMLTEMIIAPFDYDDIYYK